MKNDPVHSIRQAVAFIFGVSYSSCWWALLALWRNTESPLLVIPTVGVISGSIFIIGVVTVFLLENW